ncbi:MAG: fibrobacter succinogenes major paralogous domain-containing protein [Dysgonamonadaceae bacterium]|jgi:uncharacterized protein (TIGR02145 family)|nr:fibrobacter succinogenes major paralogous domain-containing protein [Dysgonamonadaceae bacterium]
MRKLLFFAIALLLVACSKEEIINNLPASDEGVVINGVRWATRNVAAPNTFAENPEDAGMFFQWNRKTGWVNNGSLINSDDDTDNNWIGSNPSGTDWVSGNNPCPEGWRVPTQAELMSLRDTGNSWGTRNGVRGRLFGTGSNRIFLPAAGWLSNGSRGALYNEGALGFYWSRTVSGNNQARNLTFSNNLAGMRSNARADGYSIRCVAE